LTDSLFYSFLLVQSACGAFYCSAAQASNVFVITLLTQPLRLANLFATAMYTFLSWAPFPPFKMLGSDVFLIYFN